MGRTSANKKIAATVGLLAIVIVVGTGVALGTRKNRDETAATAPVATQAQMQQAAPAQPMPESTSPGSGAATTKYRDGTYSATGSYRAPDGTQQLGIRLTIKNDTVAAASGTNEAQGRESAVFEDEFISDFESQVVGMKVDSVSVFTRATLTVAGFDNALAQIESHAKA